MRGYDDQSTEELEHMSEKLAYERDQLSEEIRRRTRKGPGTDRMAIDQTAKQATDPAPFSRPGAVTLQNVEECFTYHAWEPYKVDDGNAVREALVAACKAILRHVPDCPDRSSAIRKLREARMDANSAITFGGLF